MRLAAAALALAFVCAFSFTEVGQSADPTAPETFAQRSLKAGRIQASLARLAQHRAKNPEVRRFAAELVRDLEARNERLARIVRAEGARELMALSELSSDELAERTREFHRLRVRDGAALDKQFLRAVIVGYENAVRGYEAQSNSRNSEIRALVTESAPQMKDRLAEARRLLEDVEQQR